MTDALPNQSNEAYFYAVKTLTECCENKTTALFRYDGTKELFAKGCDNYLTGTRLMEIETFYMDTPHFPNPQFIGHDYFLNTKIWVDPHAIVGDIEVGVTRDEYYARYNKLFPKIDCKLG